jgi:hypothetical protein
LHSSLFFVYLTLVLPPGAVPVGGSVKRSGIVPPRALPEAVVPPVSVGWLFSRVVAVVAGAVVISLVTVVEAVVRVVRSVVKVVVAAGGFVVLFLSLPHAKSATESARSANIARIFFMVIS